MEYIISGPVVAMVWEGTGVVTTGRKIIGAPSVAYCVLCRVAHGRFAFRSESVWKLVGISC